MLLSKKRTCQSTPASRCPMAAASSLVHDHNISDVARKIGVGCKILTNKLNDNCDRHHLNLQQAVAIGEVTGDHRILNAWAYSLGKTVIDLPDSNGLSDDEVADQVLKLQETVGEFSKSFRLAREKGVITPADFEVIQKNTIAIIQSALHLNAEIEQMVRDTQVDEVKPNSLRVAKWI